MACVLPAVVAFLVFFLTLLFGIRECDVLWTSVVAPLIQHYQPSVTQSKPFSSIVLTKAMAQLPHIYDTLHVITYRMRLSISSIYPIPSNLFPTIQFLNSELGSFEPEVSVGRVRTNHIVQYEGSIVVKLWSRPVETVSSSC